MKEFFMENNEKFDISKEVFSHHITAIFGYPGTGKSVLLAQVLFNLTDEQKKELNIAIIDPKVVEFSRSKYPFAKIAKGKDETDSLISKIEKEKEQKWLVLVDEIEALTDEEKERLTSLSKNSRIMLVVVSQIKVEKPIGLYRNLALELSIEDDKHIVRKM